MYPQKASTQNVHTKSIYTKNVSTYTKFSHKMSSTTKCIRPYQWQCQIINYFQNKMFRYKIYPTKHGRQNVCNHKIYSTKKCIQPKNVSSHKIYPTIKYIQQHNKSNHNKYPARKCILFLENHFFGNKLLNSHIR